MRWATQEGSEESCCIYLLQNPWNCSSYCCASYSAEGKAPPPAASSRATRLHHGWRQKSELFRLGFETKHQGQKWKRLQSKVGGVFVEDLRLKVTGFVIMLSGICSGSTQSFTRTTIMVINTLFFYTKEFSLCVILFCHVTAASQFFTVLRTKKQSWFVCCSV